MTRDEFKFQFKRLCDGTKHEATPEQIDAWYSRLQLVRADDWREAVTTLLMMGKFPFPDRVNEVIDEVVSKREGNERSAAQAKERAQAKAFFSGKVSRGEMDDSQFAYNQFRMALIVKTAGLPLAAKADLMAKGLAEWINDLDHANWAKTERVGDCGFHRHPSTGQPFDHTLLRCLTDELGYWMSRAAGKTELEAREAIPGVYA